MKILVMDRGGLVHEPIKQRLLNDGYSVVDADSGHVAATVVELEAPDLVLLEIRLPGTDELEVLKSIQERVPEVPVILIAPSSSADAVVEALKLGAYDSITKPFHLDDVSLTIKRALEAAQLRRTADLQVHKHRSRYGADKLIGRSEAMRAVRALVKKIARSSTSLVLTRGETGTGKDLIARAIHAESTRCEAPYVNITCTALQDSLLESELFGHEKGAFTDAKTLKRGLLEFAHKGTVLLDEIGDISPALQAKLLRVLEERTFRRIGGTRDIRIDVRIVGATHVDLEQLVVEEQFREDLYYRLSAITIDVPPLRERREDIAPLTDHFLAHFGREFRRHSEISKEARRKLRAYDWPGNVRELRNVIERAVLLGESSLVAAEDLILGRASPAPGLPMFKLPESGVDLTAVDREFVEQALARTGGNQTKAAELLGITRDQVHYRMQKYGISKPDSSSD